MSILNQQLIGRFRGVPFSCSKVTTSFGRKLITYEFPDSDRRFSEDMGLDENQFIFEMTIYGVGYQYFQRKNRMLAALREKGPGQLEHPYLTNGGIMQVSVSKCEIKEADDHKGCLKLSVTFIVDQPNIYPQENQFSPNEVFNIADNASLLVSSDIGSTISLLVKRNFISAQSDVNYILDAFDDNTIGIIPGSNTNNEYFSVLTDFRNNFSLYLSEPETFGTKFANLFNKMNDLGETPRDRFELNRKFFDFKRQFRKTNPKSYHQRQREINTNILINSVNMLVLVNAYKNMVDIEYKNKDIFVQINKIAEDQYRRVVDLNYVDAKIDNNQGDFSEETIDTLISLRNKVRVALTRIRDNLSDIRTFKTTEQPFLKFVYNLYGDIDNYKSIVDINNFSNTIFVPSGEVNILQEQES